MQQKLVVYVNTKPVTLYHGMHVKHALISYDYSVYAACARGDLRVEDEQGFRVGLEGTLADGARLYTRKAGSGVRDEGSERKNHK